MAFNFQSYHLAWLSAHPERSERWLADRLKDGFDVHHLDGDHGNDDPDNLILIEAVDHQRIHGRRVKFFDRRKQHTLAMQEGERAYAMRCTNMSWGDIAREVWGEGSRKSRAYYVAKVWASYNDLTMPDVKPAEATQSKKEERFRTGETAYLSFLMGQSWSEINRDMFPGYPGMARARASAFAKKAGLPWPPQATT